MPPVFSMLVNWRGTKLRNTYLCFNSPMTAPSRCWSLAILIDQCRRRSHAGIFQVLVLGHLDWPMWDVQSSRHRHRCAWFDIPTRTSPAWSSLAPQSVLPWVSLWVLQFLYAGRLIDPCFKGELNSAILTSASTFWYPWGPFPASSPWLFLGSGLWLPWLAGEEWHHSYAFARVQSSQHTGPVPEWKQGDFPQPKTSNH